MNAPDLPMNAPDAERYVPHPEQGATGGRRRLSPLHRVAAGFLGAGACAFLVAAFSGLSSLTLSTEGVRVPGVVIRSEGTDTHASTATTQQTYHSVIQFQDTAGQAHEVRTETATAPPYYSIGQSVEIVYLKENPAIARIADKTSLYGKSIGASYVGNFLFLIGASIFGGIALVERIKYGRDQQITRPWEFRILCLAFVLWSGLAIGVGGLKWANPGGPTEYSAVPNFGVFSIVAAFALWWPWRSGRLLAQIFSYYWIWVALIIYSRVFDTGLTVSPAIDIASFGSKTLWRYLVGPFFLAQLWQLHVLGRPQVRAIFVDEAARARWQQAVESHGA